MKTIKVITGIFCFASIVSIACGIIIESPYSQKCIGFGVLGLFFIVFPLFSYYRWKDKSIKDYMITKESLDKMRENQNNKTY